MANSKVRPTLASCNDFHHELYALQQSNILTDFTLRVGEKKEECHRVVLAAGSPYFKGLFSSGMTESRIGEAELKSLHSNTLEAIVKYFYTCEIEVEYDNLKDYIQAIEYLHLWDLKRRCTEYLLQALDVNNALGWYRFCMMFGMDQVVKKAKEILTENFCSVVDSDEFKRLEFSEPMDYVFSVEISVINQYPIFIACLDWIRVDIGDRKKHTLDILKRVNFEKNSEDTLILIHLIANYSDVLDDNVNFIYANYFEDIFVQDPIEQNTMPDERLHLVLLGEENTSNKPNPTMQLLCHTNDFEWSKMSGAFPSANQILFFNGCFVRDGIFICLNESKPDNTIVFSSYLYHIKYKSWLRLSDRLDTRTRFSSTSLFDFVFLCGGKASATWSKELEMFNLRKNKWCHVTTSKAAGNFPVVTAFNWCVYIITNTCSANDKLIERHGTIMQIYDVLKETMAISVLPEMVAPTYGKVAFGYKEYLYLVGGINKHCHRYCTKLNSWSTMRPSLKIQCYPALTVYNGKVLLLGGAIDKAISHLTDEVCEYDVARDEWKVLEWTCPAPMKRGFVAVVAKEKFTEDFVEKYLISRWRKIKT